MKRLVVVVTIVLLGFSLLAGAQAAQEKPAAKAPEASAVHPVDINTATKEQLEQLPGLSAYADKIIEGRPYKAKNELVNRNIVPMSVYEVVKNRIVARGPKPAAKAAASETKPEKGKAISRDNPLDINTATKEEFDQLPGLGAYADKIIAGRPYKTKSDLVNRNIVPMVVYNQVKDRLVAHQGKATKD